MPSLEKLGSHHMKRCFDVLENVVNDVLMIFLTMISRPIIGLFTIRCRIDFMIKEQLLIVVKKYESSIIKICSVLKVIMSQKVAYKFKKSSLFLCFRVDR